MRRITHRYVAPLDQLWIDCLGALGFALKREAGAYATTDGKGTLTIAIDAELDPDDCLAQMIFHELCHAAVQGPDSLRQRDWGLDNESDQDQVREHATLRVQAYLLRPLGLRTFLGPTTDFRAYYDALPEDPLAGDDPAILLARIALGRMRRAPFAPAVGHALAATASMIEATAAFAELASVHAQPRVREPDPNVLPSLFDTVRPRAAFHAAGVAMPAASSDAASQTCGTCTWFGLPRARADRKTACCSSTDAKVRSDLAACERWEPMPACETCGACCREAFHVLYLSAREPFVKKHPELVVLREGQRELQRPGGRCPPLRGDGVSEPYRCALHEDRPKTCREFEQGGTNCLEARRRVGLSV